MKKLRKLNRGLSISATVLLVIFATYSTALAEQVDPNSEESRILSCSISGLVYSDDNNSATRESYEFGIPDVLIILTDQETNLQMPPIWTDAYGRYSIDVPVGTYSLLEITPYEFEEGKPNEPGKINGEVVGLADGPNRFTNIEFLDEGDGVGYNFGEWGLKIGYFTKRDFIMDPAPEPSTAVLLVSLFCLGTCLRRRS